MGAPDGGSYTITDDLVTYGNRFGEEILPGELVEVHATPYVKAEGEDKHTYYDNRFGIIDENTGGLSEVYIVGGDARVLFKSSVNRDDDLQVTVISKAP